MARQVARRVAKLQNAWRNLQNDAWRNYKTRARAQTREIIGTNYISQKLHKLTFRARPGLAWGPAYETEPKPHEDGRLCQKNQVGAGTLPMGTH